MEEFEITFSGMVTKIEPPLREKAPAKITVSKEKTTRFGFSTTEVVFDLWSSAEAKVGDFVEVKADFKSREWQGKTFISQVAKLITVTEKAISSTQFGGQEFGPDDDIPF